MVVYCRVESVLCISRSITFSYVITGIYTGVAMCMELGNNSSVRELTLVVPRTVLNNPLHGKEGEGLEHFGNLMRGSGITIACPNLCYHLTPMSSLPA